MYFVLRFLLLLYITHQTYCFRLSPGSQRRIDFTDPAEVLQFLQNFLTPLQGDISTECRNHSQIYIDQLNSINSFMAGEDWALKMFDASAKLPAKGFQNGVPMWLKALGNYKSCLEVETVDFKGKHCLFNMVGGGTAMRNQRRHPAQPIHQLSPALRSLQKVVPPEAYSFLQAHIGRCIPSTCTKRDLGESLKVVLMDLFEGVPEVESVVPIVLNCNSEDDTVTLEAADYIMIVVLVILGTLVLTGTVVDLCLQINEKLVSETLRLRFLNFSAITNTKKIFNTQAHPESITCINGIRFISMSWVLMSHAYSSFQGMLPIDNSGVMIDPQGPVVGSMAFQVIENGFPSVDSFFLIGATLLAYLTLKELDRKQGGDFKFWAMFYVHRYIRLTAVYAFCILFTVSLRKYFNSGPQSYINELYDIDACKKGWWSNLLYINNLEHYFWDQPAMCLGQSWYLANDMQFYIVSPLFLYPLWRFPLVGTLITLVGLVGATVTPILVAYYKDLGYSISLAGVDFETYIYEFYYVPWCRFQPYVLGLLLGFLLHRMRGTRKLPVSPHISVWIWAVMGAIGASVVYGLFDATVEYYTTFATAMDDTLAYRVAYNGLHRLAWSVCMFWLVLACFKGAGGPVNTFLSWSFWTPLAKLSYCIYLVHMSVMNYFGSIVPFTMHFTHALAVYWVLAMLCFSVFVAYILSVLVELPAVHLEKLAFGYLGIVPMQKPKRKEANGTVDTKSMEPKNIKDEESKVNGGTSYTKPE